MEEYTTTIINTTYQFLLQTHGISAHPTDMGTALKHSFVPVSYAPLPSL
jgi:hypothetical protein